MTLKPRLPFASMINAASIPLIAFLLWWTLNRILTPTAWCPALEEFKLTQAASLAALRCQPILLAQLEIGKYTSVGLVAALALSHLVSVVSDVKAQLSVATKFGSIGIGRSADAAVEGAKHVTDAAIEAEKQVEAAVEPKPVTREGELP